MCVCGGGGIQGTLYASSCPLYTHRHTRGPCKDMHTHAPLHAQYESLSVCVCPCDAPSHTQNTPPTHVCVCVLREQGTLFGSPSPPYTHTYLYTHTLSLSCAHGVRTPPACVRVCWEELKGLCGSSRHAHPLTHTHTCVCRVQTPPASVVCVLGIRGALWEFLPPSHTHTRGAGAPPACVRALEGLCASSRPPRTRTHPRARGRGRGRAYLGRRAGCCP